MEPWEGRLRQKLNESIADTGRLYLIYEQTVPGYKVNNYTNIRLVGTKTPYIEFLVELSTTLKHMIWYNTKRQVSN